LALRPLAVGGAFATLCDRPAGLSSATRQPRSNGRNTRGRAAPRLHAAPHQPPHLPATCWASSTLSVVSPRGQESRKPETLPRARTTAAAPPSPWPTPPWSRTRSSTPLSIVSAGATPPSSSACAPIYTPTTSSRPRRVRRIQPDTSTMRATDNHHADRRAGHVSCGPFDQRRRDGAADPARRHGLAVRNPGLRSIPPPVPMAASWW
jgi:hypothetical protein